MIDTAKITIKPGSGGKGAISFRREKYAPKGGPDGGDGGSGGNIVFIARSGQHMLGAFRYKRNFVAADGGNGQGNNKSGSAGKDYVIDVPVGTIISEVGANTEKHVICDLAVEGAQITAGSGGIGGKGNAKFSRPQNRVPLLAEDGEIKEIVTLELELQLLADIAIIGMPSAGKSSLLRASSRARPDVAAYHFTTLEPVLGFVERKRKEFILVEIPGIIEGAHRGVGLGREFLRHTRRTRGIIHLLDGTSDNVLQNYCQVREEMRLYDPSLLSKPEVVVVNKVDLPDVQERRAEIEEELSKGKVSAGFISAATGEGIGELLDKGIEIMASLSQCESLDPEPETHETFFPIPRRRTAIVEKSQEHFVVKSPRAERIVRRVDLEDWNVQAQLWGELKRMGVVHALERAGAKTGSAVKIGDWELEWK